MLYHSCIIKKIISVVFERRRMIFIDHFFFFCIIANSLHPASNYLWIGFFPSCSKKVLQLPVLCMVWECLTSHPNFFVFQIVCLYLYWLLLPVWGVCLGWFSTPFSAGELELLWRPANEQCFKGNAFHYSFCALISAVQVGCAFSFTWSGNRVTLGSGLPLIFSLLLLPKVFASSGRWCRWRGLSKAFNFCINSFTPAWECFGGTAHLLQREPLCFHERPLQQELIFPLCHDRKLTVSPASFHVLLFCFPLATGLERGNTRMVTASTWTT